MLLPQSERQLGDIHRNPAAAHFAEQLARSGLVFGGIIIITSCTLSLASLTFAHYIHPVRAEEIDMILGTLNSSACLDETTIVTVVELPPKDPHDDDDNEEDEEDDDEEDEEPAVIREPDEC